MKKDMKQENVKNAVEEKNTVNEPTMSTHELLISIIKRWGCEYEVEEESDRIYLKYQGHLFCLDAENNRCMVEICHPQWEECDLSDIDRFSLYRKLVNKVNMASSGDIVFYLIDEEEDKVYLFSRRRIVLVPEIPEIDLYLRAMLEGFFITKQWFQTELHVRERMEGKIGGRLAPI